ncbi:cytochrome P450 [Mycena olivaceomarginata]|nr:cytochrome P450 [Mycena olivaceomarginata]
MLTGLFFLLSVPLAIYVFRRVTNLSRLSIPPGPPGGLPMLGHIFLLPKRHEWLTYRSWSSELGSDIICLKVLGQHVVVLNSLKAVNELFEGRASLYSDRFVGKSKPTYMLTPLRPKLFALRNILGFHWIHGLMPYGKEFLEVRKAANKYLGHASIKDYQQLQLSGARRCLGNLLKCPEDFVQHFREAAGRTILGAAYGIQPKPEDPYMHTVFMAVQGLNIGLSTHALLYDLFPVVRWLPDWLPGLGFRREAQQFVGEIAALPDLPLRATRKAMEDGTAPHSIAGSMLAENTLGEDVIRSVTGSMYLGQFLLQKYSTFYTVATVANFVAAMINHPEAQRRAQAEIDAVVGEGRLPDFGDEAFLPYVNALVKEVMRWRNVTPLGTPHRLTADDVYDGFLLPKDSIIIGNAFAIMHDEILFRDPNSFVPDRYLDPSTKSLDVMFGFGNRICPGRYIARSTIWITIVSILSTFVISKAVDDDGHEIEVPDDEFTSGVVSFPIPFKCSILPRSRSAEALINGAE